MTAFNIKLSSKALNLCLAFLTLKSGDKKYLANLEFQSVTFDIVLW